MSETISRREAKARGLKYYYTGKPCPYGHYAEKKVSDCYCVECHREARRRWRRNNLEHCHKQEKSWRDANASRMKEAVAKWRSDNIGHFRRVQREYVKERRKSDVEFRLALICRDMVHRVLRVAPQDKSFPTQLTLGYTPEDLKHHIESLMEPGMTWDNYGSCWHIDHIIPVSRMIETGVHDPREINKLSNLQPMWADENRSKGSKV